MSYSPTISYAAYLAKIESENVAGATAARLRDRRSPSVPMSREMYEALCARYEALHRPKTIIVRLPDWSRYEAEVVKVSHHMDAGHKYSRVEYRLPDGGTTQVVLQGHFGNH